jgi:hypothetical protein
MMTKMRMIGTNDASGFGPAGDAPGACARRDINIG